ncbi:MAG: hypothetical protein GY696_03190 [Gammaproteobacteria bacterium]|nr:hypothetical protein [Gammaproteobacteria bacterium]
MTMRHPGRLCDTLTSERSIGQEAASPLAALVFSARHPAHKYINCVLKGHGHQVVRVPWLLTSGNLIPGSAAMLATFAAKIGAVMAPYHLEVGTA